MLGYIAPRSPCLLFRSMSFTRTKASSNTLSMLDADTFGCARSRNWVCVTPQGQTQGRSDSCRVEVADRRRTARSPLEQHGHDFAWTKRSFICHDVSQIMKAGASSRKRVWEPPRYLKRLNMNFRGSWRHDSSWQVRTRDWPCGVFAEASPQDTHAQRGEVGDPRHALLWRGIGSQCLFTESEGGTTVDCLAAHINHRVITDRHIELK